jgi:adhesin/invasin
MSRQSASNRPPKHTPLLHGAVKWIVLALTAVGATIGFLVNARSLGLTPWLSLGGASFANLAARRVVLAPARDTLTAIGDTLQLAATVTDEHGATVAGATPLWATDDSAVATVDSSGIVVARGPGSATITATVHEHTGTARVTVSQRVSSVIIVRDTLVQLPEEGTAQLLARALDARGRVIQGRAVRWESADTTVLAISPSGGAVARAPGRTRLTATSGEYSATVPAAVSLTPASVLLVSGGDQRASAGRRLPRAIALRVLSRGGRPVPGAPVALATGEGQGKVDSTQLTTDRDGRAQVAWTLGPRAGPQHLLVTVTGLDSTLEVTAEADPVPANTRVQLADSVPAGQVASALPAPAGIRVTDSSGAAVADVPVAWTTVDGGAIDPLASRTDSLGQAWARWTLGPRAGRQRLRVQVGNPRTMPPFTVATEAVPGPAVAAAVVSGKDQTGRVGAALRHAIVVRLTDHDGNAATRGTLRAVALSGTVAESVVVADARGRASIQWTLGREAGPQWLELTPGEGPPVRVGAQARPLEPANVAPGPAPRSGTAGRTLRRPVVFTVTDAYGNVVPDVEVVFTPTSGSVTPVRIMTDAKGRAATRWTLGRQTGEQSLTAAVRHTVVKDSVAVRALRPPARR